MTSLRAAASVLLLRDGAKGLEVFLVRRNAASEFMADVFVFPGGSVDAADADERWMERVVGLDRPSAASAMGDLAGAEALSYYVAALRETFEEAAVLLGATGVDSGAIRRARDAWMRGEADFGSWLDTAGLRLHAGGLAYWERWITPEGQPKRYDARFLLARMPAHQLALHDNDEATESVWLTPREALDRYRSRAMGFGPPQVRMLWDLQAFSDVDAVFEQASRRAVPRVANLPQPHRADGRLYLLLPFDSEYPDEALRGSGRNRAYLVDGLWRLDVG